MKRTPLSTWRQLHDDLAPVLRVFVQSRRTLLLLGAALAAVTALAGMALLGLSGWFISATALAGLSAATALVFDVFMPSSGIRLFTLLRTFARYGERLVTHDATLSVLAALRERLFRGWAGARAAQALSRRPARLLFRLTADIDALDSLYLRVLVPLGAALVAGLLAACALGLVAPWLGLSVLMVLLAGSALVLRAVVHRARHPARLRAHAVEALRARTADLVAGQTDLLLAGQLAAQAQAVLQADARAARCDDDLHCLDSAAGLAFGALGSAVLALTLAGAGWMVASGAIGVPVAVLAVLLALAVTEPFAALRRGALELGRTRLAARRVQAPLRAEPQAGAAAEAPIDGAWAVHLDGVHARHDGAALACLHGVTLRVAPGERVALVGASGAGKSSLMALLTGDLQAEAGRVAVAPHGWLTQRTELFQDSVQGNLRLARPEASDDDLWQALATAGLAATVRAWPQGLDTPLGEGGQGLSGGQARRLALARLLLMGRPLWLLDEPTEGLDDATARDVLARLAQALQGRTLLMATHTQREAALADRLVVLSHGRVVCDARRGDPAYAQAWQALRPASADTTNSTHVAVTAPL
ncbi:MAG: putative ABC transporter ATP-binding protein [Paracidovorax wautersii]|uniref:Putative ABC transporter ATP-binding protein n=1 Tax=Paracidovorax wautersii TaxID=1177982 RepID=A0A7V8JRZ5_9BURK|nr:MAG: putative ABC transporter ATP-binding protein [Paracidovorax wautersii]